MKILHYRHPFLFNRLRKLGKYLPFIWKYLSGVCNSCGKWVGMQSVVSRHGFQCDSCNKKSNEILNIKI